MPCCTMQYHAMPYHAMPYRTMPYCARPWHAIPCPATSGETFLNKSILNYEVIQLVWGLQVVVCQKFGCQHKVCHLSWQICLIKFFLGKVSYECNMNPTWIQHESNESKVPPRWIQHTSNMHLALVPIQVQYESNEFNMNPIWVESLHNKVCTTKFAQQVFKDIDWIQTLFGVMLNFDWCHRNQHQIKQTLLGKGGNPSSKPHRFWSWGFRSWGSESGVSSWSSWGGSGRSTTTTRAGDPLSLGWLQRIGNIPPPLPFHLHPRNLKFWLCWGLVGGVFFSARPLAVEMQWCCRRADIKTLPQHCIHTSSFPHTFPLYNNTSSAM